MTQWQEQQLKASHDAANFDCGNPALNVWLVNSALRAQTSGTARTYVWADTDTGAVVAFYAIAPTQVSREEVGRSMSGGVGVIPAYLLAKLALHHDLKGQGHGSALLLSALRVIIRAADKGAGRLIVVDAIDDEAAAFYQHHDFTPVPGNPRRLMMKVATARQALGLSYVEMTADRGLGLFHMFFGKPDGSTAQVVADTAEMRRVAQVLNEVIERKEREAGPDTQVDIRAVFAEALGRDPFT
jgi:GNAT superfamily N-acetyltransferase